MLFWDNTLWELFNKGGAAMWPLLFCSILGLAVVLDRTLVLLWLGMNFRAFIQRFEPLLRKGQVVEAQVQLRSYRSPVARVTAVYLAHLHLPVQLREEIVAREGSQQVARMEKRLTWLAMNASCATLLGLLGTVTGLVNAFHQIEIKSGLVQPGDLATGIWEALITTVFGLVIAIPCMAVYHFLDNRAGAVALQMQWITAYLAEWLYRPPARKTQSADEDTRDNEPVEKVEAGIAT